MIRIEPLPSAGNAPATGGGASPPPADEWRLDSGPGGGPWGRWSYRMGRPCLWLRCDSASRPTTLSGARGEIRRWADPLDAIAWMAGQLREAPAGGPPFKGGWVGYFSYDLGRLFESLPERTHDDLGFPLFEFTYHNAVIAGAGPGPSGATFFVTHEHNFGPAGIGFPTTFRTGELLRTGEPIRFPESPIALPPPFRRGPVRPRFVDEARAIPADRISPRRSFSRAGYEAAVRRAIEYVGAGDVFQVNLAQRFDVDLPEHPQTIYHRMRGRHPAWYGAYLPYGDHALLCNSPELFLRVTPDPATGKRRVLTRPIKGTRARQPGQDAALRDSVKDQAELNMIVDLERNDLGRVCEIGSVKVTEARVIEAHPTVYHGAATVEGVLRGDVTFVDLLRATFPGGSVTGAPKIRAMQIIEELEPVRRGPYCGAIGYLSVDGHMEFNVAIRTMIVCNGRVHVPVGGGIVADSDPAAEYEETLVKARAMFAALGIAAPADRE